MSLHNGHYTLSVKREYKNQINGTVIDISQSGSTYFMEPTAARKLQEELNLLHIEEENEIRRILYMLTSLVEEYLQFIHTNIEAMECLDFIFAKAELSIAMKAIPIPVTTERKIEIESGRHPLLNAADDQSLVLLDELGSGTDPAEGMGLAIAIIEELVQKNCLFITTTHYPEIKDFAKTTPGLINTRMAFDL